MQRIAYHLLADAPPQPDVDVRPFNACTQVGGRAGVGALLRLASPQTRTPAPGAGEPLALERWRVGAVRPRTRPRRLWRHPAALLLGKLR